jgi:cytochrome P450
MTRYLAESAEAREELIQKPELIPGAVEELLRRFPPTLSGRFVTEDLTFRGAAMKKGDHVLWTLGMFNLDDRQFPDPMKVDFNRKRAQHMTFGGGIHFCVGAFLARTELRIFLKHWLKIIPSFRLSEPADTYRTGLTMSLTKLLLEIDVS